jgi:hypothetical protein
VSGESLIEKVLKIEDVRTYEEHGRALYEDESLDDADPQGRLTHERVQLFGRLWRKCVDGMASETVGIRSATSGACSAYVSLSEGAS